MKIPSYQAMPGKNIAADFLGFWRFSLFSACFQLVSRVRSVYLCFIFTIYGLYCKFWKTMGEYLSNQSTLGSEIYDRENDNISLLTPDYGFIFLENYEQYETYFRLRIENRKKDAAKFLNQCLLNRHIYLKSPNPISYFVERDGTSALDYARPAGAITDHCKGVSILETPMNGAS